MELLSWMKKGTTTLCSVVDQTTCTSSSALVAMVQLPTIAMPFRKSTSIITTDCQLVICKAATFPGYLHARSQALAINMCIYSMSASAAQAYTPSGMVQHTVSSAQQSCSAAEGHRFHTLTLVQLWCQDCILNCLLTGQNCLAGWRLHNLSKVTYML